jgi:16S rRNA (uracil1498-N3)-methyltransferase
VSLPIFYYEDAASASVGSEVLLGGTEGHHAATVRRLRPGESVVLTDGHGVGVRGDVTTMRRRELVVEVREVSRRARPTPTLTVVQALPKGDRAEMAVELMTEVGVDRIVPWRADRCISVWNGDKAAKGRAKWQSAAAAAAKQSRRWWWPDVDEAVDTQQLVQQLAEDLADHTKDSPRARAFVLHEDASVPLSAHLHAPSEPAHHAITLVVGPEGGISSIELQALTAAGAEAVRLGPQVLRTSTAGAVAATLVLASTDRWASRPGSPNSSAEGTRHV